MANRLMDEAQRLAYLEMARMWRQLADDVDNYERRMTAVPGPDPDAARPPKKDGE